MKQPEVASKVIECINNIHNADFTLLSSHLKHIGKNKYQLKLNNIENGINDDITDKIHDLTSSLIDLIMIEEYITIITFMAENNIGFIYSKERRDSELIITVSISVNMTETLIWLLRCIVEIEKIED